MTKDSVKTFSCKACGASVVIRALGQTISAVCGSCHSIIDITDENYQVLQKASSKMTVKPLIPLGTRGKLHGTLWEVIGYMTRKDGTGLYSWSEYLLFNPAKGFRWLMEFDGHWNYILPVKSKVNRDISKDSKHESFTKGLSSDVAEYLDKNYYLFHRGEAIVAYVIGEFYWSVRVGEKVKVSDFINPPEILSCEVANDEVVWTIGQYIESSEVQSAFQIKEKMPIKIGVAPNQLSTVAQSTSEVNKYWAIFLAIFFVIQFFLIFTAKNKLIFSEGFDLTNDVKTHVSQPFVVEGNARNLEFILSAPVNNKWLETQIELVNDDNGESVEFEQGVEYYSGYDSDGSWSEGSQRSSYLLAQVPAGKYHLNIQAASDAVGSNYSVFGSNTAVNSISYSINIRQDIVTWGNFWIGVILVSVLPLIFFWRKRSFEMSRWSQSDFSPYYSNQWEED